MYFTTNIFCAVWEVFNIYYLLHSYTRREKRWGGRMRRKNGKKKNGGRWRRRNKGLFVLLGCYFFFLIAILHIRQLKHRTVEWLVWNVSESGRKQPHLPPKHKAFLPLRCTISKKKGGGPKSRHIVTVIFLGKDTGWVIMNIPLSWEQIRIPLS